METVRQRKKASSEMEAESSSGTREGDTPTCRPLTSLPTTSEAPPSPRRYWVAGLFYTRNERVWNVVRLTGRLLSSTIGLIILLALYTLFGALIFVTIEAPKENAVRSHVNETRHELLEYMWNLASQSDNLTRESFLNLSATKLSAFSKDLVMATQAGIATEESSTKKWTFWGGVFYSLTVYTTIGYGHIAPSTDQGRIATMIYAVIGIPLCLVVLVKVGKIFTRVLKLAASLVRRTARRIKAAVCNRQAAPSVSANTTEAPRGDNESRSSFQPDIGQLIDLYESQDSSFDVPIVGALLLVLIYMLLGAVLYRQWESWDYTEAVYFIFISISTIGFGDVLPEHPKFFLLVSIYIFVGLSFISMVVNVLMDAMAEKLDEAQDKIRELASKKPNEDSELGEESTKRPSAKGTKKEVPTRDIERVDKIDLSCIPSCTRAE